MDGILIKRGRGEGIARLAGVTMSDGRKAPKILGARTIQRILNIDY
jgi:hypothetical protein